MCKEWKEESEVVTNDGDPPTIILSIFAVVSINAFPRSLMLSILFDTANSNGPGEAFQFYLHSASMSDEVLQEEVEV